MQVLGHQITAQDFSLKALVKKLENSIITLSGPAIAISGIIAGIDLLTGGTMFKSVAWLSLTWAICLLLTLDFQVLMLGAKAKRVYDSNKNWKRKAGEIIIIVLIATAISSVSVQMQSIIARTQATTTYTDRTGQHTRNLTIDEATRDMRIDPIALIWERSALVLILIFMSGWLRDEDHQDDQANNNGMTSQSSMPAALDYSQIAQAIMPLLTPQLNGLKATIVAEIKPLIPATLPAPEPLNYQELAQHMASLVAPAPTSEPLDYQTLATQVAQLVAPAPTSEPLDYTKLAQQVAQIVAPAPLDYQEIARSIAPLLKPQFTEVRRFIIEEVKAAMPQLVAPAPVPMLEAGATPGQDDETLEQRDARLESTYQEMRATNNGKRVSGRQLADRTKVNRTYCTKWLINSHPENEIGANETGNDSQETEEINLASMPFFAGSQAR
jgi:hypothetical protein